MANTFALILVIATLITGIMWCMDKFVFAPKRRARAADGSVNSDMAKKDLAKPGWLETCASVFPVLAIVLVVRSFIYEPFQIPSGSMMQTLLIGDFILVEKYAYGIKDPIFQNTLINTGHPKRGDIVVFKYPRNPTVDYIKRVVGLPGDRVSYDSVSKQVTIVPNCGAGQACDGSLAVTYSTPEASHFVQTFSMGNGEVSGGFWPLAPDQSKEGGIRLTKRTETLGSAEHNILINPVVQDQSGLYFRQSGLPAGTWVVPQGQYFMMGDNRDNSEDSRYWGFVPEKNLVGKAVAIWMSFEKQQDEWPTGVRLNRIGGIH